MTHNKNLVTPATEEFISPESLEGQAYVSAFKDSRKTFKDNLRYVTTDGNTHIQDYMSRDNQSDVKHGLNVWYVCRDLAARLVNKAKSVVSKNLDCSTVHIPLEYPIPIRSCIEIRGRTVELKAHSQCVLTA